MGLSQRRKALLGRLGHRKTRTKEGLVLVEGVRACAEVLAAGAEVSFACVSPRLRGLAGGRELEGTLEAAAIDVVALDDGELASVSDTDHPQGLLLVCREPGADVTAPRSEGRYLILDALQDPGNVGTLMRAAAAFGVDGVLALDGTTDPWSPKAVRASAGTAFRLPVRMTDVPGTLDFVGEGGLALLVAAADGVEVATLARPSGWALAVGNEGAGVRPELRDEARSAVAIRMRGGVESLNAGVAGAILLYVLTDVLEREEGRA